MFILTKETTKKGQKFDNSNFPSATGGSLKLRENFHVFQSQVFDFTYLWNAYGLIGWAAAKNKVR